MSASNSKLARTKAEHDQLRAAAEVVLQHIAALIGPPIGGGNLADRLSLESGRLIGEFVNLRERASRIDAAATSVTS